MEWKVQKENSGLGGFSFHHLFFTMKSKFSNFFCLLCHMVQLAESQFPEYGLNLKLLKWKCEVLIMGLPGKSPNLLTLVHCFIMELTNRLWFLLITTELKLTADKIIFLRKIIYLGVLGLCCCLVFSLVASSGGCCLVVVRGILVVSCCRAWAV